MPMSQRVVSVHVAVTLRMMCTRGGRAARASTAGHTRDEYSRLRQPELQDRYAGEQGGRRKASRVRNMRRAYGVEVFGERTRELRDALGRAVRVLVNRLICGRTRVAIIRGDVDDASVRVLRLCGREQFIDQLGGHTMRRS